MLRMAAVVRLIVCPWLPLGGTYPSTSLSQRPAGHTNEAAAARLGGAGGAPGPTAAIAGLPMPPGVVGAGR